MQLAWIAQQALELIEADALTWSPSETGGPLFGYENCGELVIARALPPGPRAFHAPWLYRPDRSAVQAAIEEVHEQSGGRERWIGSWHTHPLGPAIPSLTDRRTARRIASDPAVGCPQPAMLIQALRNHLRGAKAGRLGAYRFNDAAQALRGLQLRPAAIEPAKETAPGDHEGTPPAKGGETRGASSASSDRSACDSRTDASG